MRWSQYVIHLILRHSAEKSTKADEDAKYFHSKKVCNVLGKQCYQYGQKGHINVEGDIKWQLIVSEGV